MLHTHNHTRTLVSAFMLHRVTAHMKNLLRQLCKVTCRLGDASAGIAMFTSVLSSLPSDIAMDSVSTSLKPLLFEKPAAASIASSHEALQCQVILPEGIVPVTPMGDRARCLA